MPGIRLLPRLCLILLLIFSPQGAQGAQGTSPPKLINLGWDLPTPAWLRSNTVTAQERGFDALIIAPETGRTAFSRVPHPAAGYARERADLRAVGAARLQGSFLMLDATLGVKLVPFKSPGELADAAETGAWDIANIGAEPERAHKIAFSPAYVEIQATYLVPAGSKLQSIADVDAKGHRIAVMGRSAYGLWLDRHVKHAELVRTDSIDSSYELFAKGGLDALAGLKPRLLADVTKIAGSRILDGQFTAVQQAVGTSRKNTAGAAFLHAFVEEVKASGFVASLIEKHKVVGLSVAPKG